MKIYQNSNNEAYITPYLLEGENNPCIIVCPGGAYEGLAEHEYYNELFNKMGLSVFVLHYSVKPHSYPSQFNDVKRAVRFVRYNAKEFRINPNKILIAGSSAGGHLASCAWCFCDEGKSDGDEVDKTSSKVAGAILCYPVISLLEHTHQGTSDNFSGGNDEIREKFSIQKHIKKGLSPVLMLAESCHKNGVSAELHIFPFGHHGLGEAKDFPLVSQWTTLCKNWLKENKFI